MKMKKIFAILILIVFCLGCTGNVVKDSRAKLGFIAPLTGPASDLGDQALKGVLLANELNGNEYEIIVEDEIISPKTALTVAEKLVYANKVKTIIGPFNSPGVLGVGEFLNQNEVAFFHSSPGGLNTLARSGNYGLEACGMVYQEDEILAKEIFKNGFKKLAIIYWQGEWATQHANGFKESFEKLGGEIVFQESFSTEDHDHRTRLLKMQESSTEGVFFAALNGQMVELLKQKKELGIELSSFGQFEVEDPSLILGAGSAANGLMYTHPIDNNVDNKERELFEEKFVLKYGHEPKYYSYFLYDLYNLINLATQKCDFENSKCIVDYVRNTENYQGISGTINLETDGSLSREFIMKQVVNERFISLVTRE
jgi:branched-chain amino acid transport system substrate-binding protein